MKTLILIDSLYEQFAPQNDYKDCKFLPMMASNTTNKIYRAFRKIHLFSKIPFKFIWFSKSWLDIVYDYDTIIFADTGTVYPVIKYVREKFPQKRIILWYRNPVKKTVKIDPSVEKYCEIWSFDKSDCDEFGLKYNPQFCMRRGDYVEREKKIDAYFVGGDKGRVEILNDVKRMLVNAGAKTKFDIVGVNSERISYKKVIENISHASIIVDIQCDDQTGFTLRPIESLLYDKKLITNNKNIKKEPFYNESNIFIYGEDQETKLVEFMESPYVVISDIVKEKYSLFGWINVFENGGK